MNQVRDDNAPRRTVTAINSKSKTLALQAYRRPNYRVNKTDRKDIS